MVPGGWNLALPGCGHVTQAKFQIISVYTKITTADFKTEILITNKWMGTKQSGFWQYTSFTIIQGKFKEILSLT